MQIWTRRRSEENSLWSSLGPLGPLIEFWFRHSACAHEMQYYAILWMFMQCIYMGCENIGNAFKQYVLFYMQRVFHKC